MNLVQTSTHSVSSSRRRLRGLVALLTWLTLIALTAPAAAQRVPMFSRVASTATRRLVRPAQRLRARTQARSRAVRATPWAEPTRGEWSRDVAGRRADPVNLYLHAGSLDELREVFTRAGWSEAAPNNARDNLRYVGAVVRRGLEVARSRVLRTPVRNDVVERTIQSMPVSPQSYHGHLEVAAFERDNHIVGGRHHFRVYATNRVDAAGKAVWAVSASRDIGLEFDPHRPQQGFMNHRTEPNADLERDVVLGDMRTVGGVAAVRDVALNYGRAPATGLHSADGRALDVDVAAVQQP